MRSTRTISKPDPTIMNFPALIAFEYSHYEADGFPTAVAWTLEDALYKATLIQPDEGWLGTLSDDSTALERPVSELLELGFTVNDVSRELLEDRPSGTLYAEYPDMVTPMLERLFEAVDNEAPYEVAPLTELFRAWDWEEVDGLRHLYMDRLDLSPHIAEQNIILWRAVYAHLMERSEG